MGQNRKDREWKRPRHTRFVWIKADSTLEPPVQGLVLDWRRHAYRWSALVTYVQEKDGRATYLTQWFPVERLRPVQSNPNDQWIEHY